MSLLSKWPNFLSAVYLEPSVLELPHPVPVGPRISADPCFVFPVRNVSRFRATRFSVKQTPKVNLSNNLLSGSHVILFCLCSFYVFVPIGFAFCCFFRFVPSHQDAQSSRPHGRVVGRGALVHEETFPPLGIGCLHRIQEPFAHLDGVIGSKLVGFFMTKNESQCFLRCFVTFSKLDKKRSVL